MTRSHHDGCGGPCYLCSRPEVVARRLARAPSLEDQLTERVEDDYVCYDDDRNAIWEKWEALPESWRDRIADDLIAAEDAWRTFRQAQDFNMHLAEITMLFADDAFFAPG